MVAQNLAARKIARLGRCEIGGAGGAGRCAGVILRPAVPWSGNGYIAAGHRIGHCLQL
jgi:hypothetical protein